MAPISAFASLVLATCLFGNASARPGPGEGLPFATIADGYKKSHKLAEESGDAALTSLLAHHYFQATLGLIDLHYPRALLGDAKRAGDLIEILAAVLDLQQHWLKWCAADGKPLDVDSGLTTVRTWVGTLKASAVAAAARGSEEHDLLSVLGANSEVIDSAVRFGQFMKGGQYLGLTEPREPPMPIVLAPTRSDFIGLASFIGTLDDKGKNLLWVDSLPGWSDFRSHGLEVTALEYGVLGQPDWQKGADMNAHDENGQIEHVAQKASELLVRHAFGGTADAGVRDGLATDLVIELCGTNVTRGSGNGSGDAIGGSSKFVPGGNANGGQLKRRSADSRFRATKGRDHFIVVLRTCQRQGAEVAAKAKRGSRSDVGFFAVEEAAGSNLPALVQAPVLGKDRRVQELPEHLKTDYLDFLRAYNSAFAYWLKTAGSGTSGGDPAALFTKLVSQAKLPFEEVYGVPLSTADLSGDCLELRFLKWLATQK